MRTRRGWSTALVIALLSGAVVVPPATAQDVSDPGSGSRLSALELVPPDAAALDAEVRTRANVSVGGSLTLRWADAEVDPELDAHVFDVDIRGAIAGQDYRAALAGSGPIDLALLDSEGELLAYAEHPDAAVAVPDLEWEYAVGDQLVAISDAAPPAAPSATLTLTRYTGGEQVRAPQSTLSAPWETGELDPRDPHIPFQGSHVDRILLPATLAQPDQFVRVTLDPASTLPDPVLIVLDSAGMLVDAAALADNGLEFPLAAGERIAVTSARPDTFGTYRLHWEFLPDAVTITSAQGSRPTADGQALSTVSWTRSYWISGNGARPLDQTLEYSADREHWTQLFGAQAAGTAKGFIPDGTWWIRLVSEFEGEPLFSDPVRITCTGDTTNWTTTGRTLRMPKASPRVPGKPDGYRTLKGGVTLTQRYVDGQTRTTPLDLDSIDAVLFRPVGSTRWQELPKEPRADHVVIPSTGSVRVRDNYMALTNEVPITVVAATKNLRGSASKPRRSARGGAMDFTGTLSQQWADGSWRPAVDGTVVKVQRKSGSRWRTVYTGRLRAGAAGAIRETAQLTRAGTYRLRAGTGTLGTWKLTPAKPTRTARVDAPVIRRAPGRKHVTFPIVIHQRYSDGHYGPPAPGWMLRIQRRSSGSGTWRTVDRHSPSALHSLPVYPGAVGQWRVVGTYKGRNYTSPTVRG